MKIEIYLHFLTHILGDEIAAFFSFVVKWNELQWPLTCFYILFLFMIFYAIVLRKLCNLMPPLFAQFFFPINLVLLFGQLALACTCLFSYNN